MHSTLEKVLLLKRASVFADVAAEDLAPLAHLAEARTFPPGATIVTEGELADEMFVIVSGRVSVLRAGQVLATLGPGEAVGEMALLDAAPRSATIRCDEETEVLAIGSDEFYEILHEQVEIAEGVLRVLTQRLRKANAETVGG